MIDLKDTAFAMVSPDWRERLKAEYWQLEIRIKKLRKALELPRLTGTYNMELMEKQLKAMEAYRTALGLRARIFRVDVEMPREDEK